MISDLRRAGSRLRGPRRKQDAERGRFDETRLDSKLLKFGSCITCMRDKHSCSIPFYCGSSLHVLACGEIIL